MRELLLDFFSDKLHSSILGSAATWPCAEMHPNFFFLPKDGGKELFGITVGGDFFSSAKMLLYVQDATLSSTHGKAIGRQTAAWSKRAAYQWL